MIGVSSLVMKLTRPNAFVANSWIETESDQSPVGFGVVVNVCEGKVKSRNVLGTKKYSKFTIYVL